MDVRWLAPGGNSRKSLALRNRRKGLLGALAAVVTGALIIVVPTTDVSAAPTAATVLAWGGSLGNGADSDVSVPAALPGLSQVTAVSAGASFSLAVSADGSVSSWGWNADGQLGDGSTTDHLSPAPIPGLASVVDVAAGTGFSLAVNGSGQVWAWGRNESGQLGSPAPTGSLTPQLVPGMAGAVAVAAGFSHSLALTSDGHVMAWGDNSVGQLGNEDGGAIPTEVQGLSNIVAVAAGRSASSSAALSADGKVWLWGVINEGDAGVTTSRTPVQVTGLPSIKSISIGHTHWLAGATDGTVWAWGANSDGQIGNGTTNSQIEPLRVPGLSGVTAVAAGGWFSLALDTSGAVWVWGQGSKGQLGDGSSTDRLNASRLSALAGVSAISAGSYHVLAVVGATEQPPPPPPQPAGRYVALGDSFSSGEGALDSAGDAAFDPATAINGRNECHRSNHSYGKTLKAARGTTDANFTFAACSGALVWDFTSRVGSVGQWNERPQLNAIAPANGPDHSVSLVTLTVGGNDVGFPQVLKHCVSGFLNTRSDTHCVNFANDSVAHGIRLLNSGGYVLAHLEKGPLDSLALWEWEFCPTSCIRTAPSRGPKYHLVKVPSLAELYGMIHSRAPEANIKVLLYPHLFPAEPPSSCVVGRFRSNLGVTYSYSLSRTKMRTLNALGDQLNGAILGQVALARQQGIDITAVPTASAFAGHGLCDSSTAWFNGLLWRGNFLNQQSVFSFHPTARGQAAFAAVLE